MIADITILPGSYHDSVRLMQVSHQVGSVAGVADVLVAMGTELNLGLLRDMGFDPAATARAGPDDLLIAIRAVDAAALAAAQAAAEGALRDSSSAPSGGMFAAPAPRTLGSAVRTGQANLALISVPGQHAFVEATDALRHGAHVMVFSDNVSVEHEVRLKSEAAQRGLLVMGPDCGTAIVHGVGLGFANVVDSGPVGIAGASGTGIQQLCSLLDAAGVGVRHALGTGSRDLSSAVGGASTLTALRALDADAAVEVIVVVSKPPDPAVASAVRNAIERCATPVVAVLLGTEGETLEGAAAAVLEGIGRSDATFPKWLPESMPAPRPGVLRGLFSGGTLRDEARMLAEAALGEVGTDVSNTGHCLVDYGADQYTRGRAHPMIDPSLRLRDLAEVAADPTTCVVLLDLVLGHGAHPDPAAELAPAIRVAVAGGLPVVVSLCGTRGDPQRIDQQAATLVAAGAEVYLSNAAAARRAIVLTTEGDP